uniref:Uncharacterized protein LOC111103336 n=1 Tax=Crassostrea virginica TaxID=6565 RepID=A0A8B8AQ00_CRAVI|nr:uncharacterized protein LOC111103336 [Crassostrea virginica]
MSQAVVFYSTVIGVTSLITSCARKPIQNGVACISNRPIRRPVVDIIIQSTTLFGSIIIAQKMLFYTTVLGNVCLITWYAKPKIISNAVSFTRYSMSCLPRFPKRRLVICSILTW